MKNIFKLKWRIKNNIIDVLVITFLLMISCERIEKEDLQSQLVPEKASISKQEIQRILATKANLESFQVEDEVKISLPGHYYFETELIEKSEYSSEITIGKLNFAEKAKYSRIELHNSLFMDYSLGDETIFIVPEKNPNLITIEDIKKDRGREIIHYEDKSSLVYSSDDTFTTVYFQYEEKSQSYLIYEGTITWAKKFPLNEKLDLAFYFLRNAKNMLSTNFAKQEFTWKDYVENRPKIEINLVKSMFGNFDKEMKVFLDENQSVSPKIEDYSFVELYRFNPNKEVEFFEYLNNLGGYDDVEGNKWLRDIFHRVIGFNSDAKYSILQKGNTSIVEVEKFNDEGKSYGKQYGVFCVFNVDNKAFVLSNKNEMNEEEIDFYVKMFNQFSNNGTLETSDKK